MDDLPTLLQKCQEVASETRNLLTIQYTPHGVWYARCGLYMQESDVLELALANILDQRKRNINPAKEHPHG